MKKNRSNIFTDGICNTLKDDKNLKMVFFELDNTNVNLETWEYELSYFNIENSIKVVRAFNKFELDYFIHLTGNG